MSQICNVIPPPESSSREELEVGKTYIYEEGNIIILALNASTVTNGRVISSSYTLPQKYRPSNKSIYSTILVCPTGTGMPTHVIGYVSINKDGLISVTIPYNNSYTIPSGEAYGEIVWSKNSY